MSDLFESLLAPMSYVADPSSRVFWLHWATALIGIALVSRHWVAEERHAILGEIVSSRYWFNRSTFLDYGLMFVNSVVRTFVWLPLIGSQIAGTLLVAHLIRDFMGSPLSLEWAAWQITALYMVVFFLLDDFTRFLLHLAMHRIPPLWALHKTHHSATTLTPFSVFRVHPIESGLYFFRAFFVFSLVSGVFVWLFAENLRVIDVIGVNLLGFLANALFANLRHSPVWMDFGRMEAFFVSPAQHQLHHERGGRLCNLGSVLSIWDRVLGLHQKSGKRRRIHYGVFDQ